VPFSLLWKSSIGLQPGLAVFPIAVLEIYNFKFEILNSQLSLSLFMFRILADYAHHAFTVHNFALVADFLY